MYYWSLPTILVWLRFPKSSPTTSSSNTISIRSSKTSNSSISKFSKRNICKPSKTKIIKSYFKTDKIIWNRVQNTTPLTVISTINHTGTCNISARSTDPFWSWARYCETRSYLQFYDGKNSYKLRSKFEIVEKLIRFWICDRKEADWRNKSILVVYQNCSSE